MRVHLATIHLKEQEYVCTICNRKFSGKSHLTRHYNGVHGAKPKTKCVKCERTFALLHNYKQHLKSHEKRPFSCLTCTKMFETEAARKIHVIVAHINRTIVMYHCDECDKKYTNGQNLETHVRTKHMGMRFECYLCDKKYTEKQAIKRHLLKNHFGTP